MDHSNLSTCTYVNDINQTLKQFNLQYPLFQLRFNYHDFNHRKSCFKKGCECRFELPKENLPVADIYIDDQNSVEWHFIDGSTKKISRYQYMAQRNSGDEFMNMSNDIASLVIGCNTNVGTADRSGFYYVTMYASKQNQSEEKVAYLSVCEALSRRIKHQEQLMKTQTGTNTSDSQPDFYEGFKRLMSAMYAHTSNLVMSSTMSHLLLHRKQCQFTFSHETSLIPTQHLLDWFDGKNELSFQLSQIKTKDKTITIFLNILSKTSYTDIQI